MRRRILIPLIAVLVAFGILQLKQRYIDYKSAPIVQQVSLPDRIEQVSDSVVHIVNETQDWQGSGVAISRNIIITARHVIEGGDNFTVTLANSKQISTTRAISSKKYDLGFIRINEPVLRPARLESAEGCRLGQQVFIIGSPFGKINFGSITLGIISSLDRSYNFVGWGGNDYGWSILIQTDAAAYPGNSGCPLFNMNGKVIAIIVGGFGDNLIYCVPVDLVIMDLPLIIAMFAMDNYEFEKEQEQSWNEYEDYCEK